MPDRLFVGFGIGAIQAGLFLAEAYRSRAFDRLVVAEIVPEMVQAIRQNGGAYSINVATREGIEAHRIEGVAIFNPTATDDRERLVEAVAAASEIATALPSVAFYEKAPSPAQSVAGILAEGFARKLASPKPIPCVVYTAENHNRAAEILEAAVTRLMEDPFRSRPRYIQFLNTVIGKMSGVVTDPARLRNEGLHPIVPGLPRAFLVESFNRILITRIELPGFRRGLDVFEEKDDLLPFKEAKLYGHNATHALLGYLGWLAGHAWMSQACDDPRLRPIARHAFLEETGPALRRRYAGLDPLFTPEGWRAYVEDLLERMGNPYLRDAVERIIRDPARKLGWNDRLIGAMRLTLTAGREPKNVALGAAAARQYWAAIEPDRARDGLAALWRPEHPDPSDVSLIERWVAEGDVALDRLGLTRKGQP